MRVRHMYLNKKYRLRRGLLAVGILTLAFVAGIAFYGFIDAMTQGWVDQLDGKAEWAIQESGIKVIEVEK